MNATKLTIGAGMQTILNGKTGQERRQGCTLLSNDAAARVFEAAMLTAPSIASRRYGPLDGNRPIGIALVEDKDGIKVLMGPSGRMDCRGRNMSRWELMVTFAMDRQFTTLMVDIAGKEQKQFALSEIGLKQAVAYVNKTAPEIIAEKNI